MAYMKKESQISISSSVPRLKPRHVAKLSICISNLSCSEGCRVFASTDYAGISAPVYEGQEAWKCVLQRMQILQEYLAISDI
jgi:hypothetical protein